VAEIGGYRVTKLLFLAFAVLIGTAGSFTVVSAQNAPIVMKLGTATLNDAQHEWMKRYAAMVNKDSKGRIDVQVYPASQLGSIPREIEETQFGAIQGWIGPPEFLLGVDPRYQVLGTPGLFTSWDQANRVLEDPQFSKAFLALGADKGLKGICLWLAGNNSLLTRKEVGSLEQMKDLKIRILAGASQETQMKLFGAVGVPMPLDQVLPGLQQGAIDGTLTNLMVASPLKYYAAAPYALQIGQPYIGDITVINKAWYDKLSPDLQKIVTEDAAKVGRDIFPFSKAFLETQTKAWVAGGGKIVELSKADQTALHARLASVGEDVYKGKPSLLAMYRQLKATIARYP